MAPELAWRRSACVLASGWEVADLGGRV